MMNAKEHIPNGSISTPQGLPLDAPQIQTKMRYSCHSARTPNRLTNINPNTDEIITRHVVQDGYKTPHPLSMSPADGHPDEHRVHNWKMIESRWLNVRCGHLEKDIDTSCIGCECRELPKACKKV